ncbi:Phosphoglycerate dehydrogenase [Microlunatus sagamiharensis]|uniref:Phosphoglycerate dehydrogenase n=1 Tax=Microlunatus sagamiharensis TaxID=546874 RepID=A0A1H2LJL9_9ACTN|nr:D-isomer specific 2-hydroxyacid dehydrogenase family protein [Microlunatus sagamiharensis]SDU81210.1 Phosphoglycerate dehydrogenase [Microlunatus sagamiharensis]
MSAPTAPARPNPGVHVGPDPDQRLEDAVRAGGGRVVGADEADAIVFHSDADDPDESAALVTDRTRWVQLPHAGIERWTAAGLITDEPVWTSAAGAYGPQVAEHALALLLAGARRLQAAARAQTWDRQPGRVVAGSTVALVGFGGIGRCLLPMLEPLGCRVLAVTDSGPVEGVERTVGRDAYREVLPEADFVVLLAALTPQTRGMIGAAELDPMRDDAWLVNVGRGGLVDTDALVEALREERIGGAALDVTDPEPLPDGHPLWTLPNALITPHVANPQEAHDAALAERLRENVRRFAAGEELLGVIDPEQGF